MTAKRDKQLLTLIRKQGILAAHDALEAGFHSQELTRLLKDGVIERIARGKYRVAGAAVSEHHGLVIVSRATPSAVISLLSAISFHGIGTQIPHAVWIAIPSRARRPAVTHPPVRVVRFSGAAFTEGVEIHRIEHTSIRIYGVAKTLADLFKFRNKIGLDVAIEALRDGWRQRKFKMDDLDHYARVCRVDRVMRPYIESIL